MWACTAYTHNHLLHEFTRHAVGTFVHRLHLEPFVALLTCRFVYATRQSVSPTQGATPKCGGPYPQLEGPHQSVGVRIPYSRGHTKVWESVSLGPHQGVGKK